jgi:hypothetical protein
MYTWIAPEWDMKAMSEGYPAWRQHDHGFLGGWEGLIQPLSASSKIGPVLSTLWHGAGFDVLQNGVLTATGDWGPVPRQLRRIKSLEGRYLIRVFYREPPGVPFAVSVSPCISWSRYPNHPHLSVSPIPVTQPAVMCPFLPSDGVWRWGRNNMAEFIHTTAVWLVCHQIWELKGTWPAPAASHDPEWLLANVNPNASPCVCGSGARYGSCCRPKHVAAVEQTRTACSVH